MIMIVRKPFSIDAAKSGAKVVTRDGRQAEILKYNYVDCGEKKIVCCTQDEYGNSVAYITYLDGLRFKGKKDDRDILIEEEYRPYSNAEEMDAAIKEHGMFFKDLHGRRFAIVAYDDENVYVGAKLHERYKELLELYEWTDGTPLGVLEGGYK